MSMLRVVLRSAMAFGIVVAAGQAISAFLAPPAVAMCFGYGCGFRFHAAPMYRPYFGRRTTTHLTSSPAVSRSARVNLRQHAVPSSGSKLSGSQIKFDPKKCHECLRNPNANAPNPTGQGGADAAAFSTNGQSRGFAPAGTTPSSLGAAGGAGAGQFNAGGGAGSGNASSGTGAGQFNTANGPPGGSSANSRSLQTDRDGTNGAAKGSTSATSTNRNSGTTLTAVTACVTQAGSCPIQRDLGTACQCKDTRGRIYDGIVK